MKKKFHFLIKNRFVISTVYNKADRLSLDKEEKKRQLGGKVLRVDLSPQFTKFEITDYIRLSKKQRTHELDKRANKKVYFYYYLGLCLAQKKDFFLINTSIIIRNVFDRFATEFNVPIVSPQVLSVSLVEFRLKLSRILKYKYFILRQQALPYSSLPYSYVGRANNDYRDDSSSRYLFLIRKNLL